MKLQKQTPRFYNPLKPQTVKVDHSANASGDALSTQAVEDISQEDFWDTIIQLVEKHYSTK